MKQNKRADRSICELVLKAFPPDLVSHLVQKVKKKEKRNRAKVHRDAGVLGEQSAEGFYGDQ